MADFINIGFGNMIRKEKISAIINPDAAPIKRSVQAAKADGSLIDATQGRKTKAVLFLDSGQIVISALQPETIAKRAGSQDIKNEEA